MTIKSTQASLMAWRGDWPARVVERVQERGHGSVTEFVAREPTASLNALAAQLHQEYGPDGAGDVAAEQLERVLIQEAQASGDLERCARDLLFRELHTHLPEGWHRTWIDIPDDTTTTAFRRAMALSGWFSAVALKAPEFRAAADRITTALRDEPLPEGWLPTRTEDPVLTDLFARLWKVG